MKIRKIFLDYGGFPMRWLVVLDDWSIITIRERTNTCVIYKGEKSIFDVTDNDIIKHFTSKFSADLKVLDEALEELNVELMPDAKEYYDKYIQYELGIEVEEWVKMESRKAKLRRLI